MFEHIIGRCLLILDLFTNQLHLHAQEDLTLDIMQDTKMVVSARKIELWFAGRGLMEVEPSLGSIEEWIEMFRYAMNRNVSDKIFFTIESLQNSIIFFIHNS